jgi:ribosomal protein S18 acetylase RimI-like enzyme
VLVSVAINAPDPGELAEATAVYAAAFSEPPYREHEQQAAAFAERVRRYAGERDGFRFVTSRDEDGRLTGLALAVLARPGDWWRDRAAAALTDDDVRRWLGDLSLEVVHVAVQPALQHRGIGRRLHGALISGRPAPTGVLSCHPDAEPAQRLYLSQDWTLLTEQFRTGGPDQLGYWLMARDL